jgi:CubicO group peptidase (beta-lactamase class C family)
MRAAHPLAKIGEPGGREMLGEEDERPEVEAPEALAGAEAFAATVAATLAGDDSGVARKTEAFLDTMTNKRQLISALARICLLIFVVVESSVAQVPALTAAQTKSIDRYVTAEMARQRIPGVEVGVYRNGHSVLTKGYGLANVELTVPVQRVTLMQSGSVGKQFTATAIMMLVEQGKIRLDDSIAKYFPDAPESWREIAVKNLLSHTSGLAEYETDERTGPTGEFYLRLDFTEDELVTKIEKLPIEFKPGDKWDYRNTNYVLLGVIIHRVIGRFYGDYLHDKIFAPLGMKSTRIISDRDVISDRAAGYQIEGGVLKNQDFVSPTFNSTADGDLYFNVVDLEKWDRALYGTTLLTKASLDRMWTPFLLNDGKANSEGYGFGWFVDEQNGHRVISHTGAWQGFTCNIARYVNDGVTVVVLTNLDEHAHPESIAKVIAGLVDSALMPKPSEVIADTNPKIAMVVRIALVKTIADEDLTDYFAADAEYHHKPGDAADMKASLPGKWEGEPMLLIQRTEADGVVKSSYRVGSAGDTRVVTVSTDASGKFHSFSVGADPDNR